MSLASLLSAEQIIPEMKATERWSAIVELIDLLVAQGKIKPEDRDSILASLKQREETMSPGIGFGIAIPVASLEPMRPWLAALVLAVGPIMKAGYDPKAGVERVLNAQALAEGDKIRGFETAEEQTFASAAGKSKSGGNVSSPSRAEGGGSA
ncbi:MAG: hypothetical protein DME97_11910 [Verrucomicrobia bacterium]|nr:MAG: hypothetical protein DME97_11910 [Verrucomicrobiota bacterium]